MSKTENKPRRGNGNPLEQGGAIRDEPEDDSAPTIRVTDRRHWARDEEGDDEEPVSTQPTIVDEYRRRAEDAEQKLHDYIAAFKESQSEQDAVRQRLQRDVDRKVELKFGEVVGELLASLDDLDLAIAHAEGVPQAAALAEGVALARDRFLATLQRHGVERIQPDGETFDPNVAEALRVDPVQEPERDGTVTETLRPGYRLGELVVRAAQVAVGRRQ